MLHQRTDIRYNQFTMLSALGVVLKRECRLNQTQALLVGLSGGPDSLMLIHAMHALGYPLIAAHLDHGLRSNSAAESTALQQTLAKWQIPFIHTRRDVQTYAEERHLSIEEAARMLRYEFLFDLAKLHQTQAVVVGHQADDQVETVLMHLLRGSGMAGLCGMSYYTLPNPWSATIPLVRPLLHVWRRDVLTYCRENDLHPIEDPSNRDLTFFRNRLRNELIPFLEANYNPGLRRLIQQMSDNISQDYKVILSLVERAWNSSLLERERGYLAFSHDEWTAQPVAIQRHLLRRAVFTLLPTLRDVDYEAILRCQAFIEEVAERRIKKPAVQTELFGGLRLIYEKASGRLWVVNPSQAHVFNEALPIPTVKPLYPQIMDEKEIILEVPGEILMTGWILHAEWVDGTQAQKEASKNKNPWVAWLDLRRLPQNPDRFSLRTRHPQDRLQPLGMNGKSAKITDLMINLKIPQYARSHYPILTAGGIPIWLPGFRLSQAVCIDDSTERALYVRFEPPGKDNPSP